MHAPAIEHLGYVHRHVPCIHEPDKAVPVMTTFCGTIGVDVKFQRLDAINRAQVCDVAGMNEQDGVPVGLEIGIAKPVIGQLVFIGKQRRRITASLDGARHYMDAIGLDNVVGIKRHDVATACAIKAKTHSSDDAEILFDSFHSHARVFRNRP